MLDANPVIVKVIAAGIIALSVAVLEYLRRRMWRYLKRNPKAEKRVNVGTLIILSLLGLAVFGAIIYAVISG